jgi:hypothetical protein
VTASGDPRRRALALRRLAGDRRDLVDEFFERPFGSHSPDLQYVLDVMRAGPVPGKHFLLMVEPHRRYELARFGTAPSLLPIEHTGVFFDDLLEAERYVFRTRWEEIFGQWPGP